FNTTLANVNLHVLNSYSEGELTEGATIKESLIVRSEGHRTVRRRVRHFNLDVIISVGYRVKSQRGTQFRIWATNTLRDHLIRGYTLNEKRLRGRGVEFEQAVALLSSTLQNQHLITDQGQAVLDVIQRYARSWRILRDYDEDTLSHAPDKASEPIASLGLAEARETIWALRDDMVARGETPGLFGQERDDTLGSILLNIEQTWDGRPLYPTIESRAAHLLYFVIKDHPLADGNKRSGSLAVP
ncbi:Death-on-curing family protein, partial [mine drainage metagenome]